MANNKFEQLPSFKSYEEEALFWDTHDATDLSEIPDDELTPVARQEKQKLEDSVTVRFQPSDLERLRKIATEKGIGVTSLIRMYTLEKLRGSNFSQL